LSRWRKLATPNLAGVLEHRPGVQVKGQHLTKCFEEEKYSIGDYEEDGMSTYNSAVIGSWQTFEFLDCLRIYPSKVDVFSHYSIINTSL